jgi:hypothetical protein
MKGHDDTPSQREESEMIDATTAHTPGPWSVAHYARDDLKCDCRYVLCEHLPGCVATIQAEDTDGCPSIVGGYPSPDEAKANARLIATSPDLYEFAVLVRDIQQAVCTKPNPCLHCMAERLLSRIAGVTP